MSSIFGRYFRVSTFGESHGPAIGVVVDGCPPGLALDEAQVQAQLDRRKPGGSAMVTARKESDTVEILSGVREGRTLGTAIGMLIRNEDARSKDYSALSQIFRPGHADYTYFKKYGIPPQPGGGRASGRETACRVAAGAVARAMLEPLGVSFAGYTIQVGRMRAQKIDPAFAETDPLRCADPDQAAAMAAEVKAAQEALDSVGGMVEVVVSGVWAGLGDPVFAKLDATLGGALFSIGAVKGVEIGAGMAVASRRGSQNNDQMDAKGFVSNHAGGVLGGISTGQPLVLRLAIKPTPSIAREQRTQNLDGKEETIAIKGRHDACICPRIVPVAEAMVALCLADAHLAQTALKGALS